MKNKKRKSGCDKRRMEPQWSEEQRHNEETGGCLTSRLSFHESRSATGPALGLLFNKPGL